MPAVDNYTVGSGLPIFGGKTKSVIPPAFAPSPGQLKSIHLNSLSAINPCPSNSCWFSGNNRINGPWTNWCGAEFAPDFSTYGAMLYWGGGHMGSNDTAFSVFDLTTQKWLRLGSVPAADATTGITNDTSFYDKIDQTWCDYVDPEHSDKGPIPPASHTYSIPAYVSSKLGGGAKGSWVLPFQVWGPYTRSTDGQVLGGGFKPHAFDLASEVWTRFTPSPYEAVDKANTPSGASFVDTKRGVLWSLPFSNGRDNIKIDLNTGVRTIVSTNSDYVYGPGYNSVIRYVESADLAVAMWSDAGTNHLVGVNLYSTSSGSLVNLGQIKLSNAAPAAGDGFGFDWCPDTGKFYILSQSRSNVLNVLTPPPMGQWTTGNWVWSTETMSGETPVTIESVSPGGQGSLVLSHWTYNPSLKCFMWAQGTASTTSPDGVTRDGAFQLYRPLGT